MQIEYERGISNPGNLYRMKKINGKGRGRGNIKHWFPWWFYHAGMSLHPHRSCVMLTAYFSGGRKHFRRPNFIISMPESVEQHHISGRLRAESDLLSHRPDFVIIEFSVNDESTEFFRETYEATGTPCMAG